MCLGNTGSFPVRCYLPESDLDMGLICGDQAKQYEGELILTVFTALCSNIIDSEADSTGREHVFIIRNVEFRNARTRLAHCVVNNIDVDITVNQINALASNILIEEADRIVGLNHLFKKSFILIKVSIPSYVYRLSFLFCSDTNIIIFALLGLVFK